MDSLQSVKQRFGIIGNNLGLNRALEKSLRVSNTDISVLVIGESGVGKESIPKIIHQYSHRKHNKFIAVNCGAIPEGTIDSELFGHEKGAFTGATQTRGGYFEVADGGTIFLDEVGELPLQTQVRLLRVLESGEFIKVGSSKVQKTNVRIVAATNVNMIEAISKGKFREEHQDFVKKLKGAAPAKTSAGGDEGLSSKIDALMQEAKLDVNLMNSLAKSIKDLESSAKALNPASEAVSASQTYSNELAKAASQLEELNANYQKQINANQKADELKQQMESLSANLAALNNVYGGMLNAMSKK
ncbi:sigma 54-interacting transcriptional regulator [Flavobacteriaceae bacterium]|nr:sigma 54-interacting transcriptional regulator [Flavobacteriaceae bacterium]